MSDNNDNLSPSPYQSVLDKYSSKTSASPPSAPASPPASPQPETPLPPIIPPILPPPPPPSLPKPPLSSYFTPPLAPPVLPPLTAKPSSPLPPPPAAKSPILPEKSITAASPPPAKNKPDIFKYIFFLSLLIFLTVAGCIVFTIINSQQTIIPSSPPKSVSPPTPTVLSTPTCRLNDQEYEVGQSFSAADNCNTCTCQPDLIISCTDKSCDQ